MRLRGIGAGPITERINLLFTVKTGHSPDTMDERAALLFFLPVIPLSGCAVEHSQSLLRQAASETGARFGATYFSLDSDLALAVIAIKFNRDQTEAERAHSALDRLYQMFTASGFVPCRLDIDHATGPTSSDPTPQPDNSSAASRT